MLEEALDRWNEGRRKIFYPKTDIDFDLMEIRLAREALGKMDRAGISKLLNRDVASVEFLPNAGTFHALFRIQIGPKKYYLKLGVKESAFDFLLESRSMERLREIRLPALEILDLQLAPKPFMVIEEAPGSPINRFEDPLTQAIPEPILTRLGEALAKVHQIEGIGAGLLNVHETSSPKGLHARWSDFINLRLDEHLRECMQIQAVTGMELSAIEGQFAEADDVLDSAPMRWLHGDPGHHNVFSDGEKITALIDWEDSLCGDPIFDVAYWGTFVRDEMRARFLEGYASVSPLPSDFERRYWLYYLRVAISKTVHRHRFGAKDRPGRPPASQRIQKALSKLAQL